MPKGLKGFQKGNTLGKINKGQNNGMAECVGEKNQQWKDEEAGYNAKHHWLVRHFGKADRCENPNCFYPRKQFNGKIMLFPKRYERANISGKYLRNINDWIKLCVSCHHKYDNIKK